MRRQRSVHTDGAAHVRQIKLAHRTQAQFPTRHLGPECLVQPEGAVKVAGLVGGGQVVP